MVKIDISNRSFILIGVLLTVIIIGGIVVAYNTVPGNPAVMGHSLNEIALPACTTGQALVKQSDGSWGCGSGDISNPITSLSGWVNVPCGTTFAEGTSNWCYVTGDISPEQLCKNNGYNSFTGACHHTKAASGGYYEGYGFLSGIQYWSNLWTYTCGTRYFFPPDKILCTK